MIGGFALWPSCAVSCSLRAQRSGPRQNAMVIECNTDFAFGLDWLTFLGLFSPFSASDPATTPGRSTRSLSIRGLAHDLMLQLRISDLKAIFSRKFDNKRLVACRSSNSQVAPFFHGTLHGRQHGGAILAVMDFDLFSIAPRPECAWVGPRPQASHPRRRVIRLTLSLALIVTATEPSLRSRLG